MGTCASIDGRYSHAYRFEEGGFVGLREGPEGQVLVVARPGGSVRALPVQRVECAGPSSATLVWTTWGVLHVPSPHACEDDPMRFATFAGCRLVPGDVGALGAGGPEDDPVRVMGESWAVRGPRPLVA